MVEKIKFKAFPQANRTLIKSHLLKSQIINKSAQNAAQSDPGSIYTKAFMNKLSKIYAEYGHVVFNLCEDQRSQNLLLKFLRQCDTVFSRFDTDEGKKVCVGVTSEGTWNWLESINARNFTDNFLTSVHENNLRDQFINETNRLNHPQGYAK